MEKSWGKIIIFVLINHKSIIMKKLILLLFIPISMIAQFPQIVDVEEWTSENPKMFLEMVSHWAELEAEETGYQTFVLQVMDANKLYLCRGYDNMKDLVKNNDKRWGDNGWQDKTYKRWKIKYPEDGAFGKVKPNKVMSSIYNYWPDLSYISKNVDPSKMKYRRHIVLEINDGDDSWNKFVEQTKKGVANDKKLKNNYIRLAYSPMYGGAEGSEFLFIAMDETRAKYFENLEKRTSKRNSDNDWKKMQNNNLASFVEEENIMINN